MLTAWIEAAQHLPWCAVLAVVLGVGVFLGLVLGGVYRCTWRVLAWLAWRQVARLQGEVARLRDNPGQARQGVLHG